MNDNMNSKPNLFQIATSELSQDAFFTWLMLWADPSNMQEDPALCAAGQDFIRLLIGKQYDDFSSEIRKVETGRQWENIDIWAEVNDKYLIIIEDKTSTIRHSGQLARYKQIAEKYGCENDIIPVFIYVKSENEAKASLQQVEMNGYAVISRETLLSFFESHLSDNDIYKDYVSHLQALDSRINSFKTVPAKEWYWYSWQGFYAYLDKSIDVENWSYVANPSGGFLGLWWNFRKWKGYNVYLQIEQGPLCIKIGDVSENHSKVRNDWAKVVREHASVCGFSEIHKPIRFGCGTFMTVAVIDRKDWLGPDDSVVDLEQVVARLRKYEKFLDECAASM